jgi:hypothetical protein
LWYGKEFVHQLVEEFLENCSVGKRIYLADKDQHTLRQRSGAARHFDILRDRVGSAWERVWSAARTRGAARAPHGRE